MKKLRYSLKAEFTFLFFLLVAGAILLIMLLNSVFLEKYYVRQKHGALSSAYESLNAAAVNNSITSDSFDVELQKITSKESIGIIVMNEESQTVKAYASDTDTMVRRMWDNMLDNTKEFTEQEALPEEAEEAGKGSTPLRKRDTEYFIVRELKDRNEQRVRIVLDSRTGTQYMEMWGILDDSSFYLLRTSIESIRASSATANRFVALVGLIIILAGAAAAAFLGNRIARPVRELTALSQRMKKLDFSAKYTGDDRTEIAELGRNMNELSGTLEKTILELKNANNELLQDIEKKEKIEESQREFIAGVTHELKTPISLIQGYAEGLKDGIADDEESRQFYTDVIIDEAGKMNGMVQKLLTLTQLEFGRSEVNIERFDLMALLGGYLQSAVLLTREKGIRLLFNGKSPEETAEEKGISFMEALQLIQPPVFVMSDEFMIEEVFRNYFSNAVNHAEAVGDNNEKVIEIHLEKAEKHVRVSVFNTGKPIPEASLEKIWDRFYKVDKARTREYGGSGVGLAVVKAVMERLHGNYGVVNYDNGVKFWFDTDVI